MDKLESLLNLIGFIGSKGSYKYTFYNRENDDLYTIYISYIPFNIKLYKNYLITQYDTIEKFEIFLKDEFKYLLRYKKIKKLING